MSLHPLSEVYPKSLKMGIKAADREKWNKLDKDTVVLHHYARAKLIPDGSPFGLKMETYLRMADIKYENDFKYPSSPKGKKVSLRMTICVLRGGLFYSNKNLSLT